MIQNTRMSIFRLSSRLVIFLLLLTFSAHAQQLPPAITSDPPPNKDFPAAIEAPDIFSSGSRLNAVIFVASGSAPHPTVLLLHGFPGNEKNLDLAYTLRRAGWNVLFPNYRGSWGSAGNFSFANAIGDTQAAIEFLREPGNAKKYRTDPKRIVLIGHSMGGFLAAYAAAHDPEVSAVALLAAWNVGGVAASSKFASRADTFTNASPRLAGTTPEVLIAEAKAHGSEWNYVSYASALGTRPVLILETNDRNQDDNHALAQALRKNGDTSVTEKHMETDHSFSDHRIALQVAILDWLRSLPADGTK